MANGKRSWKLWLAEEEAKEEEEVFKQFALRQNQEKERNTEKKLVCTNTELNEISARKFNKWTNNEIENWASSKNALRIWHKVAAAAAAHRHTESRAGKHTHTHTLTQQARLLSALHDRFISWARPHCNQKTTAAATPERMNERPTERLIEQPINWATERQTDKENKRTNTWERAGEQVNERTRDRLTELQSDRQNYLQLCLPF